jgi:hypothetical protein
MMRRSIPKDLRKSNTQSHCGPPNRDLSIFCHDYIGVPSIKRQLLVENKELV